MKPHAATRLIPRSLLLLLMLAVVPAAVPVHPAEAQGNADLVVVKSNSVGPTVRAGTTFDYIVTVVNNGPEPAVSVIILDDLPELPVDPAPPATYTAQKEFVAGALTYNGAPIPCAPGWLDAFQHPVTGQWFRNVVLCDLATAGQPIMVPGDTAVLTITVHVPLSDAGNPNVNVAAGLSLVTPDPDLSNEADCAWLGLAPSNLGCDLTWVPPLPHYACHDAFGMYTDPPGVTVATQFGTVAIDPGPGVALCAPALKNGEGDLGAAHLRSFPASGPAPGRLVNLTTQFGELRNVFVGPIAMFSAPASKVPDPDPPPPEPDEPHYLCYGITGPAVNETVTVESQFTPVGGVQRLVGQPQLLCLPAGKNGLPIPDAPVGVCYGVSLPFPPFNPYNVQTQFGLEQRLEVYAGTGLCVPAVMEEVQPPETPSFSVGKPSPSAPPDAILQLNPVPGGPPVVAIPAANIGLMFGGLDDLADFSYGMEYPNNSTPWLRFSVASDPADPVDGLPGTDVNKESTCMAFPGQAYGDEFDVSFPLPGVGHAGTNSLVLDENGLQDNPACAFPPGYPVGTALPAGGVPRDNLDGLEERPPSFVDDGSGGGVAGDGVPDRPVFFTLAPGSPTLTMIGATAADVLYSVGGALPSVYEPASDLLLAPGDAIDALMLWDNGDLTFGCGDWLWFSLAPGSPGLTLFGITAGDILLLSPCWPPTIFVNFVSSGEMGLNSPLLSGTADDVDALKGSIPCETTLNPDSDGEIGNGTGIAARDITVPTQEFPAQNDCQDTDDDNDRYSDDLELVLPDPSCPGKTALTSPGGDITYDDNNNGDPCIPLGTDASDDGPSWDSDCDGVLDGSECEMGTDPANRASRPTVAQCGGLGDSDGDGLKDAWEYCKWGSRSDAIDHDGDGKGDCVEVADVDGNGVVSFTGDVIAYAKAIMLPPALFGRDGDFDIDGNNTLNFTGDVIQEAKFAQIAGLCQ